MKQKLGLLAKVIERGVDIICGDFNSVYSSDKVLLQIFLDGQYTYFKNYAPGAESRDLNSYEKNIINSLNSRPYDALTLAGYVYAKPSNESTLVTNGRGNSIIDCVWFNPKTITFKACEIIDKQGGADWEGEDECQFSDHNPVLFDFEAAV